MKTKNILDYLIDRKILLNISFLVLNSCSSVFTDYENEATSSGASKLFDTNTDFETVNIFQLLNPKSKANPNGVIEKNSEEYIYVEKALDEFYKRISGEKPVQQKIARIRVQDRIIAASNQRCEAYKQLLYQYDGNVNFTLGTLTTALAGAAAIISHEQTAKEIAALAGISSGARAEFNSDYFRNSTIEVISKGIEAKRNRLLQEMRAKNRSAFIDYTVEAAIADAANYHGACTAVAGLQEAGDAITRQVTDPGLQAVIATYNSVRSAGSPPLTDLEDLTARSQNSDPISKLLEAEMVRANLKTLQDQITAIEFPLPEPIPEEESEIEVAVEAEVVAEADVEEEMVTEAEVEAVVEVEIDEETQKLFLNLKTLRDTLLASLNAELVEIDETLADDEKERITNLKNSWPTFIAELSMISDISSDEGKLKLAQFGTLISSAEATEASLSIITQKLNTRTEELVELEAKINAALPEPSAE